MKKLNIVLLSALLLSICSSAIINGIQASKESQKVTLACQADQILVQEKGCIKACTKDVIEQCKQIFVYGVGVDAVCAYDSVFRQWIGFKNRCQACMGFGVSGYYQGKCDKSSKQIDVGIALDDKNWNDKLPGIPICDDNFIYTKQRGCIKACSHPDFKKCLDFFPAIYDPKFCGLTKDGQWKSVTFQCQACPNSYPDTNYVGVSQGKCQQNVTVVVPIDRPKKCKIDTDCFVEDRCFLGTCLNRCSGILCEDGKCVLGKCVPNEIKPECTSDNNCTIFQTCNSGKCVQKQFRCGNFLCKPTQKCAFNRCLPATPATPVDLCANIRCVDGYACKNGTCALISDNNCSNRCKQGQFCDKGVCVNKCSLAKCAVGMKCVDGFCVDDIQACKKDTDCSNVQDGCFEGTCKSSCRGYKCQQGNCLRGFCRVPIPPKTTNKCTTRPSLEQCPVLYYIRAPDITNCIITQDGIYRGFARACEICQDPLVQSYIETTCKNSIELPIGIPGPK